MIQSPEAQDLINLKKYPINLPQSKTYQELVQRCRDQLRQEGICSLYDFVEGLGLEALVQEAQTLDPQCYHSTLTGNAYLSEIDQTWPQDDVRRLCDTTALGVVANDQFGDTSPLKAIYRWPIFLDFLSDAVGRGRLHYYECPLGALNIAVMRKGDYLRWHFDQSDFVVSLSIQESDQGGAFEYAYNIRQPGNENYQSVRTLLEGDRSQVKTLRSKPGTLVLFEGRYTIHRVSPIEGDRTRYMALFGFADRQGVTSSDYLRSIRYGRSK